MRLFPEFRDPVANPVCGPRFLPDLPVLTESDQNVVNARVGRIVPMQSHRFPGERLRGFRMPEFAVAPCALEDRLAQTRAFGLGFGEVFHVLK